MVTISTSNFSVIDQTLRANDYNLATSLNEQNLNHALKDQYGLSTIDYTILDGRVNELPKLLLCDVVNQQPINSALSEDILQIINSDDFVKIKTFLVDLNGCDLTDSSSDKVIALNKLIEKNKDFKFGYQQHHITHLIALFAGGHVMKCVLDNYPEYLEKRDVFGNTLLHYSACNPDDESAFVQLINSGANLFETNHKSETPLAHLVANVQKRDPLEWSKREVWIFLAAWLPKGLEIAKASGFLPKSFDTLISLSEIGLSLGSFYSTFSLLFEQVKSGPLKALFVLAYFGTNFVPILNLPIRAFAVASFGYRALGSIKVAWQQLYHRPIKALSLATVNTLNAYDSAQSFFNQINIAKLVHRLYSSSSSFMKSYNGLFDAVSVNCGQEEPESIKYDIFGKPYVNPLFLEYSDCLHDTVEKSFQETFDKEPVIASFYYDRVEPFSKGVAKDCPQAQINGGESGFAGCVTSYFDTYFSGLLEFFNGVTQREDPKCKNYQAPYNLQSLTDIKDRLNVIDKPSCIEAALDIVGKNSLCQEAPRGYCRQFKRLVSPDKNKDTPVYDFNELSSKLNLACESLVEAYRSRC